MATTAQLKRRLSCLETNDEYFTQEDFVTAGELMRAGEGQVEAMYRLWPHKREHPSILALAKGLPENSGEYQE